MPRHDVNRRCGKNARITITCLTAFVLAGMLPTPAAAQPVIQTYSTGAPGDPYNKPVSLAVDSAGNVFVADKGNHRVQRIDKNTQAVTTVVGTGVAGYGGDSGAGSQAQLDCPSSIAFDSAGALYVADPCQNVVRKVSTGADQFISGASDEIITTLVGNGTRDACVWTDGVPANQTSVDSPYQVVVDKGGNVFVLSADCTDLVRRVDAISGLITTTNFYTGYLGSNAMAFDRFGNLFLSYFGQIYVYSPSNGPYLTGTETSSTQVSYFGISPLPRAFDSAGSLYFSDDTCDCSNGDLQIFKADSGVILFAGTGISGYNGDGGSPLDASFRGPAGMAGDDIGNLFIADSGNNVIRLVTPGATAPLLESYPPNPSNQTTATFAFSSSDSRVTSFLCTLDGSEAPCVSPVTYSNLSDGSHTFSVVGETSAGDPSSPLSYTWVVDTVPPPMPSIDAHPSNPSASANAAFAFSDAEAGVSFRCTLDGAGGFCSTPAA
ncbi:MAG TPA: hypothetical protein VEU08_19080, partial [Vicinamibacterales bacterium]|nr:hypothetical protein [Vicinamibacterales bacterium]